MKSKLLLLIMGTGFLLQSCGLFKRSRDLSPANLKNKRQFEKLYTKNLSQQNYQWLSASGRVKIKSSSQNVSLSAQFKSRKDSLVWARLSKLIEVARAQADVNHFQLINRLDRSYFDYEFKELSTIIDPEQGISAFQNLLMGNIPFNFADADFLIDGDNYTLVAKGDSIDQRAVIDNKMLKLSEYSIAAKNGKTEAHAYFNDYIKTDYGWVPQSIIVKIKGADLESVAIDFSKIEFIKRDKVEFKVPENYKEN